MVENKKKLKNSGGLESALEWGQHGSKFDFKNTCKKHSNEQPPANTFYCPSLVKYMMRSVMALAPLWSQLISDHVVTNAAVESYMKVIKKQVLRGRTRLHSCDLVRKLLTIRRFERNWTPCSTSGSKRQEGPRAKPSEPRGDPIGVLGQEI